MATSGTCEHKGCQCSLASHAAVPQGGHVYCSERCADNRGCDHEHCNCGCWPVAAPEPWAEVERRAEHSALETHS